MDVGAAAAAATTPRPTFNVTFFASPAGWFKIAEIILGLLVFALLAPNGYYRQIPGLEFVMFVAVFVWILTIVLTVIYMFSLHSTVISGAPWDVIEFAFNVFCTLLYFIGAIVEAAFVGSYSVWVASTVFAWFLLIVYGCHTLYAYRVWKGELACLGGSNAGNDVNT
ncbi:CKLF-like MARVEL transmembrane domain-containing protein 8 [Styela clava]